MEDRSRDECEIEVVFARPPEDSTGLTCPKVCPSLGPEDQKALPDIHNGPSRC